jgi:hypothetical protein
LISAGQILNIGSFGKFVDSLVVRLDHHHIAMSSKVAAHHFIVVKRVASLIHRGLGLRRFKGKNLILVLGLS